jgi:NTP pyrophosphatase (non-canonical NTP hydrolase)
MNLSILDAQKKVDEIIINSEGGYWKPPALLAAIIEELGETAREVMALEKIKPIKKDELLKGINDELGDLLYSIFCLANYYKVDLENALIKTIGKYEIRDKDRW